MIFLWNITRPFSSRTLNFKHSHNFSIIRQICHTSACIDFSKKLSYAQENKHLLQKRNQDGFLQKSRICMQADSLRQGCHLRPNCPVMRHAHPFPPGWLRPEQKIEFPRNPCAPRCKPQRISFRFRLLYISPHSGIPPEKKKASPVTPEHTIDLKKYGWHHTLDDAVRFRAYFTAHNIWILKKWKEKLWQ